MASDFGTTNWNVVRAVRTTNLPRRREALARLCESYWAPLYAFVRRHGHSPEDAADLTQAFFAHVVEHGAFDAVDPALGRFRAFLLASVKHFIVNRRESETAAKRGGGWERVPYDAADLERRYEAARSPGVDPEQAFDRQWAATLLERAVDRVRRDRDAAGAGRQFDALRPFLTSDAGVERPYVLVAADLGISETAVRAAVHRLRQHLGAALRAEVMDTVADAAAADEELRYLLRVLAA